MSDEPIVCKNCRTRGATTEYAARFVRLCGYIDGVGHYVCDACKVAWTDPPRDQSYYFNRYFGEMIQAEQLTDSIPVGERGPAIAGLAQAHATCAAQLLFNLAPDVEMTKERLEEVTSAALAAASAKLKTYRAARN